MIECPDCLETFNKWPDECPSCGYILAELDPAGLPENPNGWEPDPRDLSAVAS